MQIVVRGANVHNLVDVDVTLPRDALVVFTGVSGSGKSSLAFDTIYQEGQRRFVESLSSYARQFLGQMERPAVEEVTGLSPTISIDQKTVNRNPRSTVGTVTEITDHLRLLFARLGTPHCPECGQAVRSLGVDAITQDLLAQLDGERIMVLATVLRARKGEHRKELQDWHQQGWLRARIDGELRRLDEPIELARYEVHTIELVIDRLVVSAADRSRVAEAVEAAARLGDGAVTAVADTRELSWSTSRACPQHPTIALPELEPRLFSFNAPQGACPGCSGLGRLEGFDLDRLVDAEQRWDLCFAGFNAEGKLPFAHFDRDDLRAVLKGLGAPLDLPVRAWPDALRHNLLHGDPTLRYSVLIERGGSVERRDRVWAGLLPMVEEVWRWTKMGTLATLRTSTLCAECGGERLSAIARAVDFRGHTLPQLAHQSVRDARRFFNDVVLTTAEATVGELLVKEIVERLNFLDEVGLGYLSLDRSSATLSGGEAQRIRLASQVGSALQGITYVLDEPSIGLHPRDNQRLLKTLLRLRDRGNSVLVVEHDAETIAAADYVVDVGPGAGREGGRIVAQGPGATFAWGPGETAAWMRGERAITPRSERRSGSGKALLVREARANNLHGLSARFPLGCMVVVTGVSGSGKSTLVFGVLEQALVRALVPQAAVDGPLPCAGVDGLDAVDKVIRIAQTPIGRTPRSNPATYTGAFDLIRDLFASTPEAKARGYTKGRFSFNVKGGRCEACQGAGVKTVELQFLPSVEVPCEVCGSCRFNRETLEITYKGHTIHEVLAMTVAQAAEFFAPVPKLARILGALVEVGLGYVPVGQPSTTLSGGEAQRVKLASELQRPSTGSTVYLLDEPTTGLHFADVERLLAALDRLVELGNTVIIVEHHTDVMQSADWLLDLGPEGGEGGGQLVGEGTPEHIATLDTPTGRALAALPVPGAALVAASPPAPAYLATPSPRAVEVRGARLNNLQGVAVDIPHGKLTVVTGVSGSGKSSLAFDTVFAEGQRRYVESLSTYARRFLGRVQRPPVDRLDGLAPAIAIDQRNSSRSPRSTVGTVTEVQDVLRVLYARVGVPHCPHCDVELIGWAPSAAARALALRAPGAGWVLAQLPAATQPEARRDALVRDGWSRLLVDGQELRLDDDKAPAALVDGGWLVLDRVNPATTERTRLAEAFATAYHLGGGSAIFRSKSDSATHSFAEHPACPDHGAIHRAELTPRHFSFNAQLGACPACEGLGRRRALVLDRLLLHPELPLWDALDGRVAGVLRRSARNGALIDAVHNVLGLDEHVPVRKWTAAQRQVMLRGLDAPLTIAWSKPWGRSVRRVQEVREWPGLLPILQGWNSDLDWLTDETTCEDCGGGRLRPELQAVRFAGHSLPSFTALTIDAALDLVTRLELDGEAATIAARPLVELRHRLRFLVDVGLGYLSLDRAADTLSGGEAQRIRLASQLGSGLVGVIYVLDEPTVGLHARDTARLLQSLVGLRDLGNTVLLVEHDLDVIRAADHLIDVGPGAGVEGGHVVAAGTPAQVAAHPTSLTGAYLAGRAQLPVPKRRRRARSSIRLEGATAHNLQSVSASIPTGVLVGVAGVSGSGKSSLILDTLAAALQANLNRLPGPSTLKALTVGETVDQVVVVDQSPIGRTPRSTPASYTKVLDGIRKAFAATRGAEERGWTVSRFTYNGQEGRCEVCEGRGAVLVEMHFLPDVWVPCEDCGGSRYRRETLEVLWKGRSIADVLSERIDSLLEPFVHQRAIHRQLQALVDVGLGYLTLGQAGNTLSGGEAQRLKLAAELTSRKGHCVYVLDEPTTGLHPADVARLVDVLHRLVDAGHTVIVIEHHLDLLASCDWLLELGPEGGAAGGLLLAEGPPERIVAAGTATGQVLAEVMAGR